MKIEKLDCTLTIIFAIIFSLLGGFVAGVFFELNVQKDAIDYYRLPLKSQEGYQQGFVMGQSSVMCLPEKLLQDCSDVLDETHSTLKSCVETLEKERQEKTKGDN